MVSIVSHSQNEVKKWYFGDYAGLDFMTNPPSALTNGNCTVAGLRGTGLKLASSCGRLGTLGKGAGEPFGNGRTLSGINCCGGVAEGRLSAGRGVGDALDFGEGGVTSCAESVVAIRQIPRMATHQIDELVAAGATFLFRGNICARGGKSG